MRLKTELARMLTQAENAPDQKQTCRHTNNLKIDILVEAGQTYLQVSRSSSYPTEKDWKSIESNWPYPISAEPKRIKHLGRHYLKAAWPTQPRLIPLQESVTQ